MTSLRTAVFAVACAAALLHAATPLLAEEIPCIAQAEVPGEPYEVAVSGFHAFVAAGPAGLRILDVSDPAAPSAVGAWAPDGAPVFAHSVALLGRRILLADQPYGLRVIDVEDPTNPVEVGSVELGAHTLDFTVSGELVHVAHTALGLVTIDLADPTSPVVVSTLAVPGVAYEAFAWNDAVLIAAEAGGVHRIDVSDPSDPVLVGTYLPSGPAYGVAADGFRVCIADLDGALHVLDWSVPASPVLRAVVATAGPARRVELRGDRAAVANSESGIEIFRLPPFAAPVSLGTGGCVVGLTRGVTTGGGVLYAAAGLDAGVGIHSLPGAAAVRFLGRLGGSDGLGGSRSAPVMEVRARKALTVRLAVVEEDACQFGSEGPPRLSAARYDGGGVFSAVRAAVARGNGFEADAFRRRPKAWDFKLDLEATGMGPGLWRLTATRDDGRAAHAWIVVE